MTLYPDEQYNELDSVPTGVEAIRDLAFEASKPEQLQPGNIYLVRTAKGDQRLVDLTDDKYLDRPRRATGRIMVDDVPSFVRYYKAFSVEGESRICANLADRTITAVLDGHNEAGDMAGWRQHTVTLKLQTTAAWDAWRNLNGHMVGQVPFAEHIEEYRVNIMAPPAVEMLELVQTFHATSRVQFTQGTRLDNGQRVLKYEEATNATAGAKGQLSIPEEFQLAVVIFRGEDKADQVTARLRYRINQGELALGYKLVDPEAKVETAFSAVVDRVAEQTGQFVYRGRL